MGETYLFKCPSCGYSTEVSGGKDRGFVIFTETKVCQACRELVDVVVATEKGVNAAKPTPIPRAEQQCPNGKGHKMKVWKGHVCPKCDGKMKRGEVICMWD